LALSAVTNNTYGVSAFRRIDEWVTAHNIIGALLILFVLWFLSMVVNLIVRSVRNWCP